MAEYTVAKIKTFTGMEGRGFNATLLHNGKAVCEVIDDAHGGPCMFRWLDRDQKAPVKTVNYKDEPHEYPGTVEEAAFAAYCLGLPKYTFHGHTGHQTPDIVLDGLVNAVETEKRLKRQFKTKLVFLNDGKEYAYGARDKSIDPLTLVPELQRKYPKAAILNLLPLDEAVRASLAQAA